MNSFRAVIAAIVFMTFLSVPIVAGETADREPSLEDVLARLDGLADRIEKLDQRILRLERILVKRPVRVDANGILRDEKGRAIGVWGIDANPASGAPSVPKR